MNVPDPSFEAGWRKRFEHFAEIRDDDAGIAGWNMTGLETRFRNFCRWWGTRRGSGAWLDAGCGAGTYSRHLAGEGLEVLGVDYSLPALRKARERGGEGIRWVVADVTRLPVRPASFDGVLCFGVMQALDSPDAALRNLADSVRGEGCIWVDALNLWCLANLGGEIRRRLARRRRHLRYDRPGRLQHLVRRNGFDRVQRFWLPILPARWQRFQWVLETPVVCWILHRVPVLGALLSHSFVVVGMRGGPPS
jgi:SAM-dependent methyltransferase